MRRACYACAFYEGATETGAVVGMMAFVLIFLASGLATLISFTDAVLKVAPFRLVWVGEWWMLGLVVIFSIMAGVSSVIDLYCNERGQP